MSLPDINTINEVRRQALADTVQPATIEELRAMGEKFFPFLDHPWRRQYFQFLDDHPDSKYFRASTDDGVGVLYCEEHNRGIWFIPGSGIGILQETGLKAMSEIVQKHR
ncbi:MAG TPA: hypothetical protein VLE43_19960 [Candidatus Saccharimonadia bacterium]|nr:hypothetical protein [Candidatus Saccharimonadia bacterium]